MRFSSFLLLFQLCSLNSKAQDDNVPDYRKKWESFTKVPDKDIKRDLAAFTYGGIEESAGKQPLRALDTMNFDGKIMRFTGGNMKVSIQTGSFDPSKHKLQYYENTHLQKIDAKAFFGDYGKVPKTTLTAITAIIDKDTIQIPAAAFADIYNPEFVYKDASGTEKTRNAVYLSPDKRTIYIYLLNRKVEDKYEVTWIIRDKKYLRRVVDYNIQ